MEKLRRVNNSKKLYRVRILILVKMYFTNNILRLYRKRLSDYSVYNIYLYLRKENSTYLEKA